MKEFYYWVALRQILGVGSVHYRNLIAHFGDPESIFQADLNELSRVEGLSRSAAESIAAFQPGDEVDRELDRAAAGGVSIVTFNSPDYPEPLKNIYDPPPYLYVKGRMALQERTGVAVVGSRKASEYGLRVTDRISRELAFGGLVIVSGMARGIDARAHQAALAAKGQTIAVLGSGVDVIYPQENRGLYARIVEQGAVVSEFPMGAEPNSYHFPARNRIISGLSAGVLVVEASPKSGSLITARLALEQGRDVFAIPGSVYAYKARGTHNLLKSGAKLVESATDILEEFQLGSPAATAPDKIRPQLDPEAQRVYELIEDEPAHIDDLITGAGLNSGRLSAVLLELELGGLVQQLPGKRFVRN